MWHTSKGDRILGGAEARLFKAAVSDLVESIKGDEFSEWETADSCIPLFDDLTWSQKLAVLENVTTHLLTSDGEMPQLTAVNEAAIAAIYEHISFSIDLEIDGEPQSFPWRQMVLNTCHECFGHELQEFIADVDSDEDGPWLPESAQSEDRQLWHPAVQSLADQILWDRDFEMVGEFLDEPPEKAAMLRQIMGIDDDYFSSAGRDLANQADVAATLHRLAQVLG